MANKIRQPIVSVVGHVDHGKTSILDCFRGSSVQKGEAGGITQKISFTKFPLQQIKSACPIIDKKGIKLDIPGYLFIDTPGHAAFTNLRKRGGSLSDLAILVISLKEGIKPQTSEVLQILKQYKTPFVIALNKIDTISGWQTHIDKPLNESIEAQSINAKQEFDEALLTFQGALSSHGFNSDLYYEIKDFTKSVALVPCSAKTHEGIPELLYVLCGLSQGFLKEKLKIGDTARGVILEIKKTKAGGQVEAILYDGTLKQGDEIAVASFNEPIITKVRAIEEVEPLCEKYRKTPLTLAATGLRLHLTNKEGLLSGMLFQKVSNDLEKIKESFKKELSGVIQTNKKGIIVKADSLGSLEALLFLLKQENISVVKTGIGSVNKKDLISAKANLEIDPLDAVIVGFNVKKEEGLQADNIKIINDEVVYKLIDELQLWRKKQKEEIERSRLLSLATICKLEVLHSYVFRNQNPAVFGVRVLAGKLHSGLKLIDENDSEIARVKTIQHEKATVQEATEGQEVAISLPGTNFERKLGEINFLYADIGEKQFKNFKKNKDLLSSNELRVLQEIQTIKQKSKDNWGA